MNIFSYSQYVDIIQHIKKNLPIMMFRDALDIDKFCVIRHDVEFSTLRALALAKVEHKLSIQSTYCFQLRNNCYNVLSNENINIIIATMTICF